MFESLEQVCKYACMYVCLKLMSVYACMYVRMFQALHHVCMFDFNKGYGSTYSGKGSRAACLFTYLVLREDEYFR